MAQWIARQSRDEAMVFECYVGIDYSGAETPESRLASLQVYAARDPLPERVSTPAAPVDKYWKWTRREIAEWLIEKARSGERFIAGIDHGFSFPASYFTRYAVRTWPEFLEDFVDHWPTHRSHTYVDFIREADEGPPDRTGSSTELRLTERWTSSAKSVFQFDVQGSVAKSTHAGIPWLLRMRREVGERLHFWPFDGWDVPEDKSVIAEVYPSLFRNRYPRADRTVDQQDAYATARWLSEMDRRGALSRYFAPPLTPDELGIAGREGWILGVL